MQDSPTSTRSAHLIGWGYWWWVEIQIQKGDKAFNAYAILCPLAFSLHHLSPNGPKSDLPMLYTYYHFALNAYTLS
jgi:hypothetical protein